MGSGRHAVPARQSLRFYSDRIQSTMTPLNLPVFHKGMAVRLCCDPGCAGVAHPAEGVGRFPGIFEAPPAPLPEDFRRGSRLLTEYQSRLRVA